MRTAEIENGNGQGGGLEYPGVLLYILIQLFIRGVFFFLNDKGLQRIKLRGRGRVLLMSIEKRNGIWAVGLWTLISPLFSL